MSTQELFQNTAVFDQMSVTSIFTVSEEPQKSALRTPYRISLKKGHDGWIVVTSPDLPAVVTQGRTEEEAVKNGFEAVMAVLEELGKSTDFNLIVSRIYG
jgi:predicted RNase H-like HicB family nuclease